MVPKEGEMIRLELQLPISKNARHQPVRCGKWFKEVRTKKARQSEQALVAKMWSQIGGRPRSPCFEKPVSVTVFLTFPDRRVRDGANYTESLFDCLQMSGIVRNDSQIVHHVCEVSPEFKKPGSCVVTVEELP
jgi:Holliday junction resolvase RusA-like endonuclease